MRPTASFWVCALTACSSATPAASTGQSTTSKPAPCHAGPGTSVLYEGGVEGLAADGDHVVIAGGELISVAVSGGPAFTIANVQDPSSLAVLKGIAYFMASEPLGSPDSQGKQPSQSVFESVAVTGGEPTVMPGVVFGSLATATDDDSLYFDGLSPGTIVRLTPPSTTPVTLATGPVILIDSIAAHGDYVYVAGQDLASATTMQNGTIERIPKGGGAAERIVSNIGHPWSLLAHDTGLYWIEDPPSVLGSGTIVHANLDGSSPRTFVDSGARSLAIVNDELVFALDGIEAVPLSGGTPRTVVSNLRTPGQLTAVGGDVVWVDPSDKALSDPTVPQVMAACVSVDGP